MAKQQKSATLVQKVRKSKEKISVGTGGVRSSILPPHLIVVARAGTGKTTTLVEGMAELRGLPTNITPSPQQEAIWDSMKLSKDARSIRFTCFNKSIADVLQAKLMARGLDKLGCEAGTMHAFGFKAVKEALGFQDPSSARFVVQDIIADIMGRDIEVLRRDPKTFLVVKAVDELVGLCKVNLVNGENEDELYDLASYYDVDLDGGPRSIMSLVPQVLDRCKRPKGKINYDDMIWLPCVLDLPVQKFDLLLTDEAQDLNRVQQALAKKAGIRHVMVGDPCQCHPPGTLITKAGKIGNRWHSPQKGITVPIEQLNRGDGLVGYSPSDGAFVSNRIVEAVSKRPFKGQLVEVTTSDGWVSRYTPEHRCYASFDKLRSYHAVYLMKNGNQFRVGSCQINYGGSGNGLVHRLRTEKGEASWLLELYPDKVEARLRELEISHKYNLPTIVFPGISNDQGYILNTKGVTRFWDFVGDNYKQGIQVLKDCGLELGSPIAVPGKQWNQSFKRPCIFAACNLRTGMSVRTGQGKWVTITVNRVQYSGPVYSLSVSHNQLYLADNIITHNSIYGFAGADCESMSRMQTELGETEQGCIALPLTVTRRCGRAIVKEANKIVTNFEAHESNPEGVINYAAYSEDTKTTDKLLYHDKVEDGDMVLCRCNAPLVSQCFRFLKSGRKATIQGRDIGAGLTSAIKKLWKKDKQGNGPDVVSFYNNLSHWLDLEQAKEQAKKNPNEGRLIGLQDRHDCLVCFASDLTSEDTGDKGKDKLIKKIESIFTDNKDNPGIRLSSIHKAKGLEANRVFLLRPKEAPCPHPMAKTDWQREQEMNCLYVAITRSINELVYVS